jgi:hypothetical protein
MGGSPLSSVAIGISLLVERLLDASIFAEDDVPILGSPESGNLERHRVRWA